MSSIDNTAAPANLSYELPRSFLAGLRADKSIQIDALPDTMTTIGGQPALRTTQSRFRLMDGMKSIRNRKWRRRPGPLQPLEVARRYTAHINANAFLRGIEPATTGGPMPPPSVTHRVPMTSVRNQGPHRNTCVAHATVAAMEMRLGGMDLSEQCAHHHLMRTAATPTTCCVDPAVYVIDAGNDLSRFGVPQEAALPYTLDKPNCNTASNCSASRHADPLPAFSPTHSITSIGVIPSGPAGAAIGNVAYLESIIAAGFDIVYEFWWAVFDENADVIDVYMFQNQPLPHGNAAHTVLLTGYDRTNHYFIGRNSFGPSWGAHRGDIHLSYRYVTTYGIAGFFIKQLA